MDERIERAAVLGATGGVGRAIARALRARGAHVRVVSRSRERLEGDFPDFEVLAADLSDTESAREAVDGVDTVFHCVGVALDRFDLHVPIARAVAGALEGRRCVLATSYWSYTPIGDCPYDESHPRRPVSHYGRVRRDQEDILVGAGACAACLPDFIGPEAETTVINHSIQVVSRGKRAMFPGDPRAARDFVTMADAGRLLVELAAADAARGRHVLVTGSGPVEPRHLVRMGAEVGGAARARMRGASPGMMLVASLLSHEAHAFRDLLPIYRAPAWAEGTLLGELTGDTEREGYESIVRRIVEAAAQPA